MNKKGEAHIEMILSFIIFVSFLLFALVIMNPFKNQNYDSTLNTLIKTQISNNAQTDVTTFSLSIPETGCVSIDANGILSSDKIFVKDSENNKRDANFNSPNLYIDAIKSYNEVFQSDEFPESISNLNCNNPVSPKFGQIKTLKVFSNKSLVEINDSYNNDYNGLKQLFGFPMSKDFGFILKDSQGNQLIKCIKANNGNFYETEDVVQVIYSNGDLKSETLEIVTW